MYMKFYISIGVETFRLMQGILTEGARQHGLSVEFETSGKEVLDLGVKLTGDLDQAPAYVEWFLDIVELFTKEVK
jgi:hypothetical protein